MASLPVSKSPDEAEVNRRSTFAHNLDFDASPSARLRQLWLSECLADVFFQVANTGQLMPGHKMILQNASQVFYAQFSGHIPETNKNNRENPIIIEDIEPAIFKEVLRYIYCEQVALTADNIVDIYYASEKYLLIALKRVCDQYLNENLRVDSVLTVLNANRKHGFTNVDTRCLDIIRDDPVNCFQSKDFLTLSQTALELIAACRTMNCQKGQLETAIREWCKANESTVDFKPQLETLQCDKIYSFSAFRYDTDVSTDLNININGKMYLHGLGVFIGGKPTKPRDESSVAFTIKIQPGNLIVSRNVQLRKSLYVEEIIFNKFTVTRQCRISVTFPHKELFCLEEFKPVDTLGRLDLQVTDMKLTGLTPTTNYYSSRTPGKATNCVAYLLYSLDPREVI